MFIDPVSTGFSRAVKGEKSREFHGYGGDIESVGEVIRLWTTRNGRWMSPKYLCGESYGTTRAAGLARHLQERYGLYLNGLMLISAVLDFGTAEFGGGNDDPYALYLPTYAAVAHYHGKHGDRPLPEVLAEARGLRRARVPVGARPRLPADRGRARRGGARLAELTGLSADYVDRVNLRPEHIRFLTELLRDRRLVVGRIDGRFTGWDTDYGRETWTSDPSIDAIVGPYTAALNHYVRAELGYCQRPAVRDPHRPGAPVVVQGVREPARARAGKLAAAMRANPHMRVHVDCGYHDLATPYFAAEHSFAHLADPGRAGRQHLLQLLRGRSHDVPARAEPAGPGRRAGSVSSRG